MWKRENVQDRKEYKSQYKINGKKEKEGMERINNKSAVQQHYGSIALSQLMVAMHAMF